jgi:DNA polymerase
MLNKWIAAMGLRRDQVYIANIVKCRPPNNRVPMPDEVATCTPYLERQLEIIRPRVIMTLGLPSLKYMTGDPKLTMGRSRGQWRDWRGIKLMPTFHPAYVLRAYTDETRAAVWSDLQAVMKEVGLPLPSAKKS